jgi:hypothetical protein
MDKLIIHYYRTYNGEVLVAIHTYSCIFFLIQIHLENIHQIEHATSQTFNTLESISFIVTPLSGINYLILIS